MHSILPEQANSTRTRATAATRRLRLLSILLVIALGVLAAGISRSDFSDIGVDDFIEYWSAGRLNVAGGNPYAAQQMKVLEQAIGWQHEMPVMMWNPPPTLTLVMPFGLLPYLPARLLWLLISGALVVIASDRLWQLYGGARQERSYALLIGVFFMPTLSVLQMGQIGVWIMIGVVGFSLNAHRNRWLAAGACFALTAIKPHVAYLLWIALALWWLHQRRWRLAIGGISVVGIAWLLPTLINPHVTAQYLDATINTPPLYWRTMTWGTILRLLFGIEHDWLQLVAPGIGAGWLVYWWLKRRDTWNWTAEVPRILLVSASTMAFGWFFDMVVLLPVIIQMGVWLRDERNRALRRTVLLVYVGLQLLALAVNLAALDAVYYVWFAPSLLVLYLGYLARRTQPQTMPAAAGDTSLLPVSFDMGTATD